MKSYRWPILLRILFLPVTFGLAAYLAFQHLHGFFYTMLALIVVQLAELYNFHQKIYLELDQFSEAIRYRDFSRHYNTKGSTVGLEELRIGFNSINTTFKTISREKETQYQYLQKILELVGTGILSYEAETGNVLWMNETLKTMLRLPYLKNISALQKRNMHLYQEIISLKNSSSAIVTLQSAPTAIKVLLSATGFQTEGRRYKLLALQNVNEALDETESRAWQKLLSVMTHEIMNSIAPISSLADTLKKPFAGSQCFFYR